MEYIPSFSNRLKALRSQLGLSQRDFAQKVGITASALSTYENGQKNPSVNVAVKIASEFNVSLDWLCGLKGTPKIFIPDNATPFDLQNALDGLLLLIQAGLITIYDSERVDLESIDYTDIINEFEHSGELFPIDEIQRLISDSAHMEHLLSNGSISERSYRTCIQELLSDISYVIQRNRLHEYEERKQTQAQNEESPF